MSQFVAHRIMPCNPLQPATRWVDAPCEVADLHDRRKPAGCIVMMGRRS
jgi:hypothetical protein